MILRPFPVSSDKFTFSKNTFISEMSDMGRNFQMGRVYDDACDAGFTIVSKKTGKSAVFAFDGTKTDNDGDITSWNFVCVTPGLKDLKVVIFND